MKKTATKDPKSAAKATPAKASVDVQIESVEEPEPSEPINDELKISKTVDIAMSSLGLMSALKGMGTVTMPTVPEEERDDLDKRSEDEENDDDDEDLERAQVSTRGLNKGLVRPDENFNNDDLELTQVTQVRLWDTVHGKMIDAESDADYLNGSPGPSSPEKLSFPTSRPQIKNELRESVDSGQGKVDALLEEEEDYE